MWPLHEGTFDSRESTKFRESSCLVVSQLFLEKNMWSMPGWDSSIRTSFEILCLACKDIIAALVVKVPAIHSVNTVLALYSYRCRPHLDANSVYVNINSICRY